MRLAIVSDHTKWTPAAALVCACLNSFRSCLRLRLGVIEKRAQKITKNVIAFSQRRTRHSWCPDFEHAICVSTQFTMDHGCLLSEMSSEEVQATVDQATRSLQVLSELNASFERKLSAFVAGFPPCAPDLSELLRRWRGSVEVGYNLAHTHAKVTLQSPWHIMYAPNEINRAMHDVAAYEALIDHATFNQLRQVREQRMRSRLLIKHPFV